VPPESEIEMMMKRRKQRPELLMVENFVTDDVDVALLHLMLLEMIPSRRKKNLKRMKRKRRTRIILD